MSLFGNTKELKNTIQSLESEVSTLKEQLYDLRKNNESYVKAYNEIWWKYKELTDGTVTCSVCYQKLLSKYSYCPHCGSKVVRDYSGSDFFDNHNNNAESIFAIEDDGDGCLIVRYNGFDESEIVIPSQIKGKIVIGIGEAVFQKCKSLRKIIFREGCQYIGKGAFAECENLSHIRFPESLKEIGSSAFRECKNLQQVILPANLEILGGGAFYGCSKLKRVVLSEKLTHVSSSVFSHSGIEECIIPESVLYIDDYAFAYSHITELELPNHLLGVGRESFANCRYLKKLIMHSNITNIDQDALMGTNAIVYCAAGSVAQQYARKNNKNITQIQAVEAFKPAEKRVKYISIDYTGRNFYNFDWISQIAQILKVPKASMWCWTEYNKSKYMCIFKEFSLEQAQEIKDKLCNYPVEVQFRMRE